MRRQSILVLAMAIVLFVVTPWASESALAGEIVAWGWNHDGQCDVPVGNDFVAIAAGASHSLAVRSEGSLAAWGNNYYGQLNVPAGNDFVDIAAGIYHSLALKSDGSLAAWGDNRNGQSNVPAGNDFVAIAGGWEHSLTLKSDGSLVGWGDNTYGQTNVPSGNDFVAIAAGWEYGLALNSHGSVVAWGRNDYGQCNVPTANDFVGVAAGRWHSLALRSDGSLVAWGRNNYGQSNVPAGNDFIDISAGGQHNLALKNDGSLVAWGSNDYGQCDVPEGNDFVRIAAGASYSLALVLEPAIGDYIDWFDLAVFSDKWLENGCSDANDWCGFADINRDEDVDFVDFALLAQYWEDTAPVPGPASNPDPNDTATDVSITADLSWTAGSDAAAHGVYFGTNPTPDANEFQSYQTATIFDPCIMNAGTTYYWRVDEVGLGGETTGDVWSFTTAPAPGQASNPIPRDGASDDGNVFVGGPDTYIFIAMDFDAGVDANSHEGFFSDNLALVEARDASVSLGAPPQPATYPTRFYVGLPDFIPNHGPYNDSLVRGTTYYWCVDETDNQSQLWQGAVWSFTIRVGEASNPDPYDFEELISVTPVLTWQQGASEGYSPNHEHDIYFGTNWADVNAATIASPEFRATQPFGDEDWEPVADGGLSPLDPNTTYYWRIDEVHSRAMLPVVFKGEVWTFTTEAPSLPGQATNPNPADTARDVSITADLSWTAGYGATSHDVYFGTNPTPGVNQFQGNQLGTTFEPGTLDYEITYYWRIDEVGPGGMTTGVVWSFTTEPAPVPGQASNPDPNDTATEVSITTDLGWTAGSDATSHDVYFGTNPTPDVNEFQGNQTNTAFDPGALNYETTYYWRIDEVGPGGTTTGVVWSFTTEAPPVPGQATNPSPANMATNVSINVDLNWMAGYGSTSHDVYFGTNPTPDVNQFQGNQASTTFDPATLDYETTYYWRIDEVGPGGTTIGVVWSFTTEAPSVPGQATNPSPANMATNVSITACLSWTVGPNTTSHDVYFGTNVDDVNDATTDSNEYMGNQDSNSWDPGGLDYETTYYWRIDEIGPGGTTTGEVWSFTTMPDPNLVSWWKFDETSGVIAYDSSGNENHGMLVDGIGDGLVWVPTQGALNFDGSNNLSRVMIPATAMTTTAGTIAIWANLAEPQIRGDGRNGSGYFFGCDNGVKDRILLYMDNSNTQLDIRVGDHSENNIITLGTEVWYHIALTWNGGVYAVYVNGSERGTGSYGGLTSLPSTADIGNNGSSSKQSFHGLMGDVQFYDKSLSATEIQELCQDVAN